MTRGVSGGERKRVTIGEMEFGNKYVTLMDEITTGLDSAAAYDIVKSQRSLAQALRKTVVMALLQPSPEVFALFDNVLILNEGFVLYHGPRDQCESYFASLGLVRPPGRDVADFLMDLGTSQQVRLSLEKDGIPCQPAQLAERYQQSTVYAAMMEMVERPLDAAVDGDAAAELHDEPTYHLSFWRSVWILTKRELQVTWRNVPYIQGRGIVVVVIGLIYATLFYDFDPKNVQIVMGTIFPAILFFTLGQTAQMPLFLESRAIFYKQRGAHFYRTAAYVVASGLNQIPIAVLESTIFGVLVYWFCGFTASASSFLLFELVLVVTSLAFAAWFFLLTSVAPDIHVAEPLGMLSILFYILFAGFIVTHQNIPDYFIWAYWLNPIAWAVRSLAINQYGVAAFDTCVFDGIDYCTEYGTTMGVASLKTYDLYTERYWLWLGVGFMLVSIVVFMGLAGLALEYARFEGPEHDAGVSASDETGASDAETTGSEDADGFRLAQTPRDVTVDVSESHHHAPRHATPVTLAFKDLWYSVPNPENAKEELVLLRGISGYAKPGTMTALMGASGAGKTTLMDVIAGRKTGGTIRGEVLLNGHAATDLTIRRATGYCEQMDVHCETATFREALTFSAFLRQGADVSDAQKLDSVDECLDLLDLRSIADKMIHGSSVEQMKRLTIGVELAAQPSVLFLDEPTSGLDARAAKLIMDGVRKVADTGRTIVCTIHQPSWEVFQVFDSLLLLKRDGETVYFGEIGPNASEMVQYFESIDGVAPLPVGYNPATWMLKVIGAGVGDSTSLRPATDDFVAVFNVSAAKKRMHEGLAIASTTGLELAFAQKRAASNATQASFLVRRFFRMYWRSIDYNLTRFVVTLALGLIFGATFARTDFTTYQGINAGVGMVFTAAVFVGVVAFDSVMPLSIEARNVFYRERAAQTYSALWFFVGSTLAEIPYVAVNALVFSGVFFPTVGFSGVSTFLLFWVHMALHVLLQTYMGQFLAFVLPSLEVSATAGILVTSIFFLFMGFNPPASQIPSGYKWLYSGSPPTYSLAILTSIVFGECEQGSDSGCQTLQETPATLPRGISVQQYLDDVFLIRRDELWRNFGVIIGCIVLFRLLALLALRFVSHQKK